MMNWTDGQKMIDENQIVGSHTHNHEVLSTLTIEQVRIELEKSKKLIEEHSDTTCKYFSYPNGSKGDFTEKHKSLLRETGYVCAFSQIPGFNNNAADVYELKRINISEQMTNSIFEANICGFLPKLKGEI